MDKQEQQQGQGQQPTVHKPSLTSLNSTSHDSLSLQQELSSAFINPLDLEPTLSYKDTGGVVDLRNKSVLGSPKIEDPILKELKNITRIQPLIPSSLNKNKPQKSLIDNLSNLLLSSNKEEETGYDSKECKIYS